MYIVKQITPQNKYEKNKFHYKEHKHYLSYKKKKHQNPCRYSDFIIIFFHMWLHIITLK